MVLTLAIPIRAVYGLEDFITIRHLQNMAKVMLVTGLIVVYGYMTEMFISWYSADRYEVFVPFNRVTGPYAPFYFALLFCNAVAPQALWYRRVRSSPLWLFVIAIIVNIGMWLERFIIIITSLHRDFMPSAWGRYAPTIWDWSTFVGTIGLFLALLFLFVRFLPMISIFEMRTILPEAKVDEEAAGLKADG
jgi:molybdopterin-containing oxidoreductase family membrane subunit